MRSEAITPDTTVAAVEAAMKVEHRSGVVVRQADGRLAGVATLTDVGRVPETARDQTAIGAVMRSDPVTVRASEPLDAVLEQLTKAGIRWAPVVDEGARGMSEGPIGVISVASIMDAYHQAVAQGTRRMRSLVEGTVLVEVTVTPESRLSGKQLRQLHFPAQTLVVSIRRAGALVFPRGDTELRTGDAVTFLTNPAVETRLRAYLAGPEADHIPVDLQPLQEDRTEAEATEASGTGPSRRLHLTEMARQLFPSGKAVAHAEEMSPIAGEPPKAPGMHQETPLSQPNTPSEKKQGTSSSSA